MVIKMGRITYLALMLVLLAGFFTACSTETTGRIFDISSVTTFRDIPGVTNEEIAAIEALKAWRQSFSFGTMLTTEAFILPDGSIAGFLANFTEFLSNLFGIPFILEFHELDSLASGLVSGTIDFLGNLTPTPERRQFLFMSYPIAARSLGILTYGDSVIIQNESDLNGLRIGFFYNAINAQFIMDAYPELSFQTVFVRGAPEAAAMLETGQIDAFVLDSVNFPSFADNPLIRKREIFPLVFSPVSMTTGNPQLEPIISVLNKYIAAGGFIKLHELYKAGNFDFSRHMLSQNFTDEERAFLDGWAGRKVPIALETDIYPISFYNERERAFQGISVDVLAEISALTGLEFKVVNDRNTTWVEILEMLRTGEAALVSKLVITEERKKYFIWPCKPYFSSSHAFLSREDFPNLELFQIQHVITGAVRGTASVTMYDKLFPGSANLRLFETQSKAFDALESGEIDLFLALEFMLLYQTHFRERHGFKANFIFPAYVNSYFGINKNEEMLRSIISKALAFIDTETIARSWTGRVFDYTRRLAHQRIVFIFVFTVALAVLLFVLVVLFLRNNSTSALYKKQNELYKAQMATLSAIYKNIPDFMFCKDINLRYTSCNPGFEKMVGLSESEIIGKNVFELGRYDEKTARDITIGDEKVLREKAPDKIEMWLLYDGAVRLFQTIKVPLLIDGNLIGLLGMSRDITDIKMAVEAANNASMAKSNFLAKMSHEIRTPMNAIIGMAELALRADNMITAREHIFTVKQSGANLLSIINDILDFSKVETGKLEIIPDNYLLSSLINDVISIAKTKIIDSQISFVVNADSRLPNALVGDEIRIRQVLLNVLDNAIKYTEKGFVLFFINWERTGDNSIQLIFEIKDTGKGMKQNDIGKVFSEYVQLDIEQNKHIQGTGLGLAIAYNITRAMGGNIDVISEYRKGSTFTITLPQKIHTDKAMASVENPEEKSVLVYERRQIYANSVVFAIDNLGVNYTLVFNDSHLLEKLTGMEYTHLFISFDLYLKNRSVISEFCPGTKVTVLAEPGETIPDRSLHVLAMPIYSVPVANLLNGMACGFSCSNNRVITGFTAPGANILVVDDIISNLKVARGLLLPYKMQVDICKNGIMAIEAVKTTRYDVVFMDHLMPDMDGIEVTRQIRALGSEDPYYENLPIVALTANAVSGTKEMFLANGFSDFLSKPIDTIMLNAILEKWVPKEKREN